jgi:hypothetical protein
MPNRTEARSAKAALTHATGRLPLLRLFSTPLIDLWALWQWLAPESSEIAYAIGSWAR